MSTKAADTVNNLPTENLSYTRHLYNPTYYHIFDTFPLQMVQHFGFSPSQVFRCARENVRYFLD